MPELVVKKHGEPIRRFGLTNEAVLLGRDPGCDIVLTGAYVSHEHVRFERHADTYQIVDEKSHNGTFLNGSRLQKGKASKLKRGDEIAIADYLITYWDGEDDATETYEGMSPRQLHVEPERREVWIGLRKLEIQLSVQEFDLLALLCERNGRIIGQTEIGERIWGSDTVGGRSLPKYEENMIHRLVFRLRGKLKDHAGDTNYIVNVPGAGYRLNDPS